MIVRLQSSDQKFPHGLTLDRDYTVLGFEADWYRIVDDDGEPCLYDPSLFTLVDPTEPECWSTSYGSEGERYSYPAELDTPGFFEDWHDGVPEVRKRFNAVLKREFGRPSTSTGG